MIASFLRTKNPIGMAVSIIMMSAGLLVALMIVPDDVSVQGALMPSAIVMCLTLLTYPILRVMVGGVRELLRCEVAVIIGFTYLALGDAVQPYFAFPLDESVLVKCYLAFALFVVTFIMGAHLPGVRMPRILVRLSAAQYSVPALTGLTTLFFAVAMFNFMYTSGFSLTGMLAGLQAARFDAPWTRGSLGGWNAFTDFLTNSGYLLPAFTVLLKLQTKRWLSWQVILASLYSSIFLLFLAQNGGRRLIAVVVGAALLTWLLTQRSRLNFRHLATGALITLALVVVMELMLSYRNVGFGSRDAVSGEIDHVRVDENLVSLGRLISAIPDQQPYVTWHYLLFAATLPVPRVFWEGKPTGPGFSLGQYVNGDEAGTSYTETCAGEWYMAFGFFGIAIGGLLQGTLAHSWEALLRPGRSDTAFMLYSLGVMIQIGACRSTYELELMSYCLVFWVAGDAALSLFNKGSGRKARARGLPTRDSLGVPG